MNKKAILLAAMGYIILGMVLTFLFSTYAVLLIPIIVADLIICQKRFNIFGKRI
jgi:hypothetical protein